METSKKITLSTFKSFVRKNEGKLFVNVTSDFDGMTDCIEPRKDGFNAATKDKTESKNSNYHEATLGINGVWLVRDSRDYFKPYNDGIFSGIAVSNSCGRFIIATKNN